MIQDFKGDSAVYQFSVKSVTGTVEDISAWKLICEIWDGADHNIKKATANVIGGSDSQIRITDGLAGEFEIYINKNETSEFLEKASIEVAMLLTDQKDTIYRDIIDFSYPKINWEQK